MSTQSTEGPIRRVLLLVGVVLSCAIVVACDNEVEQIPRSQRQDIDVLRRIMLTDPAIAAQEEVDLIADDRPVLAGQLLMSGAVPAAEQQVERIEQAELSSEVGLRLRAHALRVYGDRIEALRSYGAVLEGAATDDEAMVNALGAMSSVERGLMALHEELDRRGSTTPTPTSPHGEE